LSTITAASQPLQELKAEAKAAVIRAKPRAAQLIRLGYAAKGAVYCLIGALGVMAGLGAGGGRTTGSRGALKMIADEPFGRVVLIVLMIGLASYALWQFFRTAFDPEHDPNDHSPKALGRRIVYLVSGCIHAGLVVAAAQLAIGHGAPHDDNAGARDWTARLMGYPAGLWLVVAIGAGFVGGGVWQFVKGLRADLDKQLALEQMTPGWHRLTIWAGRLGIAARGIVFNVIGGLLILAAYHENPSEAKGLSGALATLQRQSYGPWLLAGVAMGLFAYGIYLFIRARYRRIELT
jgi:hypothetical protein